MGRKIREIERSNEVVDGVLNFFVNYDCFTYKAQEQTAMGELQVDTRVKEGD